MPERKRFFLQLTSSLRVTHQNQIPALFMLSLKDLILSIFFIGMSALFLTKLWFTTKYVFFFIVIVNLSRPVAGEEGYERK